MMWPLTTMRMVYTMVPVTVNDTVPKEGTTMTITKSAALVATALACATPVLADVSGYGFGAPQPGPGDRPSLLLADGGADDQHEEAERNAAAAAAGAAGAAIGSRLCGSKCGVGGAAAGAYLHGRMRGDPYRQSDQHHEGGGRDGAYGNDMSGGEAAGDGVTGGDMGY
jgi:hypothetical protein